MAVYIDQALFTPLTLLSEGLLFIMPHRRVYYSVLKIILGWLVKI